MPGFGYSKLDLETRGYGDLHLDNLDHHGQAAAGGTALPLQHNQAGILPVRRTGIEPSSCRHCRGSHPGLSVSLLAQLTNICCIEHWQPESVCPQGLSLVRFGKLSPT